MTKLNTKSKGHRNELAKFHVQFYAKSFFDPNGELEEGEAPQVTTPTVKFPVKINTEGDDSRSNVTTQEIKAITHFDGNIEAVLESKLQIKLFKLFVIHLINSR